jgi:hypothetical protein
MPGRPFSTHAQNPQVIDALHAGVPEWMRSSLDEWLKVQLTDPLFKSYDYADISLVQRLERLLRTQLGGGNEAIHVMESVFYYMNQNDELKLDVVEGLLQLKGAPSNLEEVLQQSGSKWKVARNEAKGIYSLQERVDDTVAQAAAGLAAEGDSTADYLVKAWNDAFGRNPDPSTAYGNIVKAVEAASWRLVTPANSRSTLGTIIRELKDNPESFVVAIEEKNAQSGIESVRTQMSLLWEGQTDRHGTSNPVPPTQEAAEQAVFIGLSLCQQFTRGLVTRTQ